HSWHRRALKERPWRSLLGTSYKLSGFAQVHSPHFLSFFSLPRHRRSYSRHETTEDPAHIAAVVKNKRKALGATARSRLSSHLPRVGEVLDAAFACGEQVSRQSKKLIELLDDYGAGELNAAIEEALERQTPRADSLALILERRRRKNRSVRLPVDLSHHPHLRHFEDLSVPAQNLEVYDEGSQDNK